MYRMTLKYKARKPTCIKSFVVASAVGLEQFYPALVIWSVGVWLSLIIIIFECIIHRITMRQMKKVDKKEMVVYLYVN